MKPELRRFGSSQSPVVILDQFTGDVSRIVDLAAALAPFPSAAGSYYPGLRRIITPEDRDADAYVERLLQAAAPYIGGGFDVDGFDLIEASFSMVTTPPDALAPVQRAPHFDSTDPKYLAILHYLSRTPSSGTAFYRHRATGIERIEESSLNRFVSTARTEQGDPGYIQESNRFFERIGMVEAVPDRLVIYQGSLLHSGVIPPAMNFSDDPREGRLTANIFIRAY